MVITLDISWVYISPGVAAIYIIHYLSVNKYEIKAKMMRRSHRSAVAFNSVISILCL